MDQKEANGSSAEMISPRQILILALSVYVLIALFVDAIVELPPQTKEILDVIDALICFVFIADFFIGLWYAQSKGAYLKWAWIDLLSSIPMWDMFRWGRAVRLVRIMRLLRAIRSTKVIVKYLLKNRAKSTFAAATFVSVTLALWASIAILNLENLPESNIKTAEDALWWSCTTMTTVGYGDKYPITTEGRVLGLILMIVGVGLFGTFTGYVASWFLQGSEGQKEEAAIEKELHALSAKVDRLTDLFDTRRQDNERNDRSQKEP